MDAALYAAIAGAAAAVFSPIVTLVIAHRRMSGSISSSDATELWKSASEYQKSLLERIRQLNTRQRELETRIDTLEAENHNLYNENVKLRANYGGS